MKRWIWFLINTMTIVTLASYFFIKGNKDLADKLFIASWISALFTLLWLVIAHKNKKNAHSK